MVKLLLSKKKITLGGFPMSHYNTIMQANMVIYRCEPAIPRLFVTTQVLRCSSDAIHYFPLDSLASSLLPSYVCQNRSTFRVVPLPTRLCHFIFKKCLFFKHFPLSRLNSVPLHSLLDGFSQFSVHGPVFLSA